ncbi:zinc ribbon domain-containing protein [Almyronema epifaneia]|uniref:Zinc ribbon domain-containing protein n=1 Tax=Almyronema epifaneia S1 TaxID=2991925 RepID=A0ABW6IDZ1_9CYAN
MPVCPRCQQSIQAATLQCPRCQLPLKAYGHPGIQLHRAEADRFLCPDCTYHADNTCNFPQRPLAKTCTLYQSQSAIAADFSTAPQPAPLQLSWVWFRRNLAWWVLAGLLLISLLIAI